MEVWQADRDGAYDIDAPGQTDRPYRLRSLLRTDAGGGYGFDTVQPGHYGTRARATSIISSTPTGTSRW